MDIEKLKQDLLKKAQTLEDDFALYCIRNKCSKCDFKKLNINCLKTRFFIVQCDAYSLGADKQSVSHDIDNMLKDLFPNFYEYITKRELQP